MSFNWDEFLNQNNKIIVHCKTQAEADNFCKQMHEHGLTWCTGTSYLNNSHWRTYKEETVYDNEGSFCYLDYYKKEGNWTVLKYSDYLNEDKVETVEEFLLRIGRKEMVL